MTTFLQHRVSFFALAALGLAFSVATGEPDDRKKAPPTAQKKLPSVAEARERAKFAHTIYVAALEAMHHHYFRREQTVIPARAMQDVFADVADQSNVKARWISVNTRAMSIDHEPRTDFERDAARAIAAGKGEFELVENGLYQRAGAVPLGGGCIACHAGMFAKPAKGARFAGLIVSMPVEK